MSEPSTLYMSTDQLVVPTPLNARRGHAAKAQGHDAKEYSLLLCPLVMASSFVKGKLKGARDALGKKEYVKARDAATDALSYEPDNYNACVINFTPSER